MPGAVLKGEAQEDVHGCWRCGHKNTGLGGHLHCVSALSTIAMACQSFTSLSLHGLCIGHTLHCLLCCFRNSLMREQEEMWMQQQPVRRGGSPSCRGSAAHQECMACTGNRGPARYLF